jgi:glucan-binding YG repeat protein
MAMIERNKLNDLDAAEKRATELRRANPDDTDAIMANLHVEQQRIQNAYESEIMTITERDTPHYQYPQYAPKPKPAEKQAAPVAAPSWLDRAKSLVGVGQPATAPAQQAAPATLRSAPKEGDVRQYQGATYTFDGTKWVR